MRETIEAKIRELEAVPNPSTFQTVARGSLLGALGQIKNAEDNLKWHEDAQKKNEPAAPAKSPAK